MRLGLGTDISVGYRQPLFGGVPLLLDTYTGAAAAYSLRQLRTGVTNVVRVREDSANTEEDFTAEQITDGTLLAFVGAGNNGHVVTWYDQSGNGNDATQATAANQPKIVDAGSLVEENGKPAVDFDGVNDSLTNNTSLLGGLDSFSFVSVAQWKGGLFNKLYTESDGVSTSNRFEIRKDGVNPRIDWLVGVRVQTTNSFLTIDNQHLVSVYRDGANGGEAYIDNNLDATIPSSTATINIENGVIGTDVDGGTWFNGGVQELILYTSDQSANRVSIEANINEHYNIYP